MSFSTDKQTLQELNIPGKFRQGSVYALFNKVRTTGGERLLNEMFAEPLSDAESINERSSNFQYFQQHAAPFPFNVQQIDAMRGYLDANTPPNVLINFGAAIIKKVLSSLTHDEQHKKDIQGLHATISVLNTCHQFLQTLPPASPGFGKKMEHLTRVLENPRLRHLRELDIYQPLSLKRLAAAGHLLKVACRDEMEKILEFVYASDVYICVAAIAVSKDLCYAAALPSEGNVMEATGLYHPCMVSPVGNSISLTQSSNVMFLTGANMAGKSTLMKAVGINFYLAHMGFPVGATSMRFSVREGMYSSINVSDNINLGYSHFYAEVMRVKRAASAAAAGQRLLLMFDELFKGTNVKDAFDGTLAVTEAFSEYRECIFIISTHIIEVGEALRNNANLQFVYMPTIMDGVHPRYTYHLKEGITEDRQGMTIIRNEGILELLG